MWQLLEQPAPDGGLWNSTKVADWLSQKLGRRVSRQRGWEYLQQMGFRLKVPGPSHDHSDFSEQMLGKKLSQQLTQLQSQYPVADIEVWCEDQQRLGLQPKIRRVGTQVGQQPVAGVKIQYQWLWLYGFLQTWGGETSCMDSTSSQHRAIQSSLRRLTQFDQNQNQRILLVLSQGGWHTTDKVALPEGIDLFFLPSHFRYLQPGERLWPLTNEAIGSRDGSHYP